LPNVPTLGEGGDFNHKCRCGKRMMNIAVNVKRSTAPPLLPNVCYALVAVISVPYFNRSSKHFYSFCGMVENFFNKTLAN